jgi:hypothetical protein
MWTIAISCDGCGADLAWVKSPHRELKMAAVRLKSYAGSQGWERVDSSDEEAWYCKTCRLARGTLPCSPQPAPHAEGG